MISDRGYFLRELEAFGFRGRDLAIADTIARWESEYDWYARRVESSGRESRGAFQVLDFYSPELYRNRRLAGEWLNPQEQMDEFRLYMADPYMQTAGDLWTMFRRYNGSGAAAERYADRAVRYMELKWPEYIMEQWPVVSQSPEVPSPERSSASAGTSGSSFVSGWLPLSLVGLLVFVSLK